MKEKPGATKEDIEKAIEIDDKTMAA